MNHLICRYIILITFMCIPHARPALKRFVIVSDSTAAQNLYPSIRNTKPFQNEPDIKFTTKEQICLDVTSSYFFRTSGSSPYEKPSATMTTRFVGRPKWMYPTKIIKVWLPIQKMTLDEWTFVCLARKGDRYHKYYVSEEYNLDADTDYIPGRFIFHNLLSEGKSLFGLAETAAEIIFHPDYAIENIYLEQRAKYRIAWKVELDSLCGLPDDQRKRVCGAVLWLKDTAKKHTVRNVNKIKAVCRLQTVSFQTMHGHVESAIRKFREWMLVCAIESEQEMHDVEDSHVILSQTYRSNQVIIHHRNETSGLVFPDTLLANIRLVFNSKNHRRPAADETVAEDYLTDRNV